MGRKKYKQRKVVPMFTRKRNKRLIKKDALRVSTVQGRARAGSPVQLSHRREGGRQ